MKILNQHPTTVIYIDERYKNSWNNAEVFGIKILMENWSISMQLKFQDYRKYMSNNGNYLWQPLFFGSSFSCSAGHWHCWHSYSIQSFGSLCCHSASSAWRWRDCLSFSPGWYSCRQEFFAHRKGRQNYFHSTWSFGIVAFSFLQIIFRSSSVAIRRIFWYRFIK